MQVSLWSGPPCPLRLVVRIGMMRIAGESDLAVSEVARQPVLYPQQPYEEAVAAEVWRMLRRRKLLIAASTLAGVLLAALYVVVRSPRYEATARIEVSPAGTNSLGLDERRLPAPADSAIQLQSAVAILRSSTIARGVMKQLRMSEKKDFAGRWVQPAGSAEEDLPPEIREHLLTRFSKALKVEIVPKTDIVSVQFRAKDPELAAAVVNSTVSTYTERNFRSSYDSATQVSIWLMRQMEDLRLKANQAQEKLAELQKTRGLIGGDETDNIVTEKLKGLDEQLTELESDRIIREARYRIAASGNPELIATTVPEPTLQVLRTQQAQLRVDYARLSAKFGNGYPKLTELGNQLTQVEADINRELKNLTLRYKNEYEAAQDAEKMLRARFEEQKLKVYELNQSTAQYAILKREVETTQDLYQTLQLKLRQAGIVAGLASANITVVETGEAPAEPVDPKPGLDLLLGLGTGLGVGLLSALGLEALDSTLRTSEEAERITGLPVLACVPQIPASHLGIEATRIAPREHDLALPLITWSRPHSSAAEAYRSLRTALLLGPARERPKIVVVTSALAGEGKTRTAVNCATVLAQQGRKVLLVDADLRKPALHEIFAIPQDPGLTAAHCEIDRETALAVPIDAIDNLWVLPSGTTPDYPAEMLASQGMANLIDHWRAQYDHVVIDTPPVSQFTDAVVVAAMADATILLARAGTTGGKELLRARDVLQRANASVTGVVLNGTDVRQIKAHGFRFYASARS